MVTFAARLGVILWAAGCSAFANEPIVDANGPVVEVLGLRRWTVDMIRDSLNRYAPGDSLHMDGCAATLRYRLGFADAAVTFMNFDGRAPNRVMVIVREPQDSSRVRFRMSPLDTAHARPEWRTATDLISEAPGLFQAIVVKLALDSNRIASVRFRNPADSVRAVRVAAFVRGRDQTKDLEAATLALRESPNVRDRSTAVLILGNFRARPVAAVELVDALLESDGPIKMLAARVLMDTPDQSLKAIDWSPASNAIRAILDGTSVAIINDLISVLVRSGAGPEYARVFLRGGGDMLLGLLESKSPNVAGQAHRLLVNLRGGDLGLGPEAWKEWIATL